MRCYLVEKNDSGEVAGHVTELADDALPKGNVLIRVAWSSLNYKDALAASGHPGVVKDLPHIPGIDLAGTVVESDSPKWQPGDQVLVTGYGLGASHWGGWADLARVDASWPIRMPENWTPRTAMIYGTAGFTAARCVMAIQDHGVEPDTGPILVTGASGGVGSLAVRLLAPLGYEVVASTGKQEADQVLRQWGASDVVDRQSICDQSDRPVLRGKWAGVVDTVGGQTLSSAIRQTLPHGCVTACGMVGGSELPITVFPFILRGVTLAGIDSATCPRKPREEIWRRLSTCWQLNDIESNVTETTLDELGSHIDKILQGHVLGRTIVRLTSED